MLRSSFLFPRGVLCLLLVLCFRPVGASAHGSLENGRMLQVRVAGPNGGAPAPWNESYYTWNQDSNTFPGYASAGFSYAGSVPDGTIASAGINDGVQSSLNFSGLNNASPNWQQTGVAAGANVPLHWLATAAHNPSHFLVYLTRAGVNPDTKVLAWADLELLGSWAIGSTTNPVTNSTRTNPVGGTILSYDWTVPIPTDRSGHAALVVIWQRDDPAGEAFFAVQDLAVTAAVPTVAPRLSLTRDTGGSVSLDLLGTPGQAYDLQVSESLDNPAWTILATGAPDASGHWLTTDPSAAVHIQRFYRTVAH